VISVRRRAKAASDIRASVAAARVGALRLRQDASVADGDEERQEQLLAELRAATRGAAPADEWGRARALAAEHARVSTDRHAGGGRRLSAPKRLVRRLLRWYVEPVFDDQRLYNEALLRLADDLRSQVEELEAELERRRGANA